MLAEGRNAEVFAYGDGRVLKLDRPEWTGLSPFEGEMLELLAGAGLPVARSHGAVTVDGRSGIVLDRIDGVPLSEVLAAAEGAEVEQLAERFVELQWRLNAPRCPGSRRWSRVFGSSSTPPSTTPASAPSCWPGSMSSTTARWVVLHYDFHPDNVLVTPEDRWVVIDWLTVAAGPAPADLARTLVLWGQRTTDPMATFMRAVRRLGADQHGLEATRSTTGCASRRPGDWARASRAPRPTG